MKAIDINKQLVNSYLELLKNLSPGNKLDLIAKLTKSVQADIKVKKKGFEQAFGAWEGNEDPEDLINTIRESRTFNRNIEEL